MTLPFKKNRIGAIIDIRQSTKETTGTNVDTTSNGGYDNAWLPGDANEIQDPVFSKKNIFPIVMGVAVIGLIIFAITD
jgi:hypothetical protein